MVSTVVDFSERAEGFVAAPLSWWEIFTQYYLNFIPYINNLLWPIFVLISVIFFTSRMARDSEIISIFNAGVSFRRLLVPYMLSALFLTTIQLVGAHFIVPNANEAKFKFENTYLTDRHERGRQRDVHISINPQTQVFVRYYSKSDTSARDIRIEKYRDNRIVKVTSAQRMEWIAPQKWKIEDYVVHAYDGLDEQLNIYHDSSKVVSMDVGPGDFVQYEHHKEWLTSPEIIEYIRQEKKRGQANTEIYETELHRRTADAISILILTLIGMTLASRKVRGGVGLHLASGFIIGAIYIFLSKLSVTLASSDVITPAVAVWIPNLIFGIISFFLIAKAQK